MSSDVDQRITHSHPHRGDASRRRRSLGTHVIASGLVGALTAAFLLVGRWEPGERLDVDYVTGRRVDFNEPRFLIAAALAVVVATLPLARLLRRRRESFVVIGPQRAALILGTFLVLSVAWSIDRPSGAAKATELVLLGFVALLFGASTVGKRGKLARDAFWVSLIAASGLLGVMGVLQVAAAGTASTDRNVVTPLSGGANAFGRNMAFLTVALIALALGQRIPKHFGFPAAAVSGLLVTLSGSRGALVALTIGVLAAVILTRPRARTLVFGAIAIVLALVFLAGSTTVIDQAGVVAEQRLDLSKPGNQFTYSRAQVYRAGIACYVDYPITGAGLAGFVALSRELTYPHNIFLEIACEGGSIAVFLSLWVLVAAVAVLWKKRAFIDPLPVAVLAVAIVHAQFSGDLFDSRGIAIFGILALTSLQPAGVAGERQGERPVSRSLPTAARGS